jgi:hypothetical protein
MMTAPVAPDALSDPRQNAMPAMMELRAKPRRRGMAASYDTAPGTDDADPGAPCA